MSFVIVKKRLRGFGDRSRSFRRASGPQQQISCVKNRETLTCTPFKVYLVGGQKQRHMNNAATFFKVHVKGSYFQQTLRIYQACKNLSDIKLKVSRKCFRNFARTISRTVFSGGSFKQSGLFYMV